MPRLIEPYLNHLNPDHADDGQVSIIQPPQTGMPHRLFLLFQTKSSIHADDPIQTDDHHLRMMKWLTRDNFNLHKMLVVVTSVGKV